MISSCRCSRLWLRRARLVSRSDVNCRRLISESASLRASMSFSRWESSVNRQKSDHPGAGEQHRDTVDQRPQPRVRLSRGVVEDQRLLPRRADAVADHGEDDVEEERRPVLVERDEPDDDEEVEVRLDGAVREPDERRRAVDQPGGDGHGGRAPVTAQHVPEHHRGDRRDRDVHQGARRVAEHQPQRHQRRDVHPQHPEHQAVTALPVLLGHVVAVRKGVEKLSPHRVVHHFRALKALIGPGVGEMVGDRQGTAL